MLTIGQLAKQAGVKIDTVRYYERRKLIPTPQRRESGYRQYAVDDVSRIRFIKRAQGLGFSLNEIGELLALKIDTEAVCDEVRRQAESKIADIEAKIETLSKMQETLSALVQACLENELTAECPILESLRDEGDG